MNEMGGGGERRFLDNMEGERSPGALFYTIGYSSVIITEPPATVNVLHADDDLSRALSRAPGNTLPLFADAGGRTVYVGAKDEVEKLIADLAPIELKPVEVITGDNSRYTLLSLTEHAGRFAFNVYRPGDPEGTPPITTTVEALRKWHPRPAF